MLYENYLKNKHPCPFCILTKEEIIKQNKYALITLAKAPYTKDHLLVIPKKHHVKLSSLSHDEKEGVEKLLYYGMRKLHKKYRNVTIIYREGDLKKVGKSVLHLHYHLIPKMQIGSYDICLNKRKIYSDKEYFKKIKKVKAWLRG